MRRPVIASLVNSYEITETRLSSFRHLWANTFANRVVNTCFLGIHLSRDALVSVVSVGCVLRTNARGALLDRQRCVGRTLQNYKTVPP